MSITLYNSLGRKKQALQTLEPGHVRMYVCGMTVYDFCHLGHARVLVAFDVISRYLRSRGYKVTYVRNITDVDDKIINRAAENNEAIDQLTNRFIEAMHEDEARLGVLRPEMEPRATDHIEQIISMVQTLIDKEFAYQASNGDVYYRVTRFADYGKLSGKNIEQLLEGVRIENESVKEDPRDFALWKACPDDQPGWESPFGWGRPGWHIECSAMSTCCLGDNFDIHGGGPDLPFPHHENEIAQSEAATGKQYANYWMHAGAVRVDGEKMSKSLGNFFTIRDILEKYPAEVVRYLLVASHYRSAINYSEDSLKEARHSLERFYNALKPLGKIEPVSLAELEQSETLSRFTTAMDDDFNTPEALAVMFELVRKINSDPAKQQQYAVELVSMGAVLGILQLDAAVFFQGGEQQGGDAERIEALIEERRQARQNKDFARSDEIRDQLASEGIILEDSAGITTWKRQ